MMPFSDSSNVCEEWWDNCCCSPIGYICCCRRMRRSSRIQILWGWLLLIAIGSCVVLGALVYKPDMPYATPSDMRAVIKNFHPLFCAGAKISSPHVTFDAYLIQGDLRTDTLDRQIYESKSAFYVDAKQVYFFTFYLLIDSSIIMRHCPNQFVTFYVFRGQDNFDWWKKDQYCEECYLFKRYLYKPFNCDAFSMKVDTEDEYFLVYSNEHKTGTWVDLHVSQNRSIYDLGDSSPICSNVYSCEVVIYDLEQTAIYQVNGYYNLDDNNHPVFTTECVPRIWSYVIIHGLISVFIGAICTVFIHKCCKESHTRFTLNSRSEERAPLLTNQLPPSYSTVVLTPPKYEDIAKDFDSDLPSYSDVLAYSANGQCNVTIHIANPTANESSSGNIADTTIHFAQNAPLNQLTGDDSISGQDNSNNVPQHLTHSLETSVDDHFNGEHSHFTIGRTSPLQHENCSRIETIIVPNVNSPSDQSLV